MTDAAYGCWLQYQKFTSSDWPLRILKIDKQKTRMNLNIACCLGCVNWKVHANIKRTLLVKTLQSNNAFLSRFKGSVCYLKFALFKWRLQPSNLGLDFKLLQFCPDKQNQNSFHCVATISNCFGPCIISFKNSIQKLLWEHFQLTPGL